MNTLIFHESVTAELLHVIDYEIITHCIMEELYELSRLNLRSEQVVNAILPSQEDSPLRRLKEIIYSDEILDNHQCMMRLYGKVNIAAFSRLKSRLKEVLEQAIFYQNASIESSDSRIVESLMGYRQAYVARVLNIKKSNLAIPMIEKSLTKSLKYQSAESVLFQVRVLVNYYGLTEYNKYKYLKYLQMQKLYSYYYTWEIKAEQYVSDMQRMHLHILAAPTKDLIGKAKAYADELTKINDVDTFTFNLNKYKAIAIYLEYIKDFKRLLIVSNEFYIQFNRPEYRSATTLASISLRKIYSLIQLGKYFEAIELGLSEMKSVANGSITWYLLANYTAKAYLYSQNYIDGYKFVQTLISNNKFVKLQENFKELIYTTYGYSQLMVNAIEQVDGMREKNYRSENNEFKLGKLLNATPVYSKDKRGINISILLLHIALLLQRKDYNAIIDKVDSLKQYSYRYLRKDDSYRSNCMIKMVIQMTKADFNKLRTERYTKELYRELERNKLVGSGENIEIEIVPFEVLWNIMLKSL